MKKILFALAAAAVLAGCGEKDDGIRKFTVGFDADFPPYGYKDGSEYKGFDLDLAREVCARKGWKFVANPINWDAKDMELNSGSIDCIWNGFTIQGREDLYTWTVPYVDNSQVIVVKANSGIKSAADLAGKNLVVQSDSSAQAALTGEDATEDNKALVKSLKELTEVADYNSAFMMLESGAVDAIALDVGVADYQLAQRQGFVKLDLVLAAEQYGIGFKLGNTELRDTVEKTLMEMVKDGTFTKIAEDWGLGSAVCLGK